MISVFIFITLTIRWWSCAYFNPDIDTIYAPNRSESPPPPHGSSLGWMDGFMVVFSESLRLLSVDDRGLFCSYQHKIAKVLMVDMRPYRRMNEGMSCRKIPFPLFDNISRRWWRRRVVSLRYLYRLSILCHHNKQSAVDLLHRISVCLRPTQSWGCGQSHLPHRRSWPWW